MRVPRLLLILSFTTILGLIPAQASAQTTRQRQTQVSNDTQYSVSGKIIDADNGSPLEMVNITFENNTFWAVTDMKGKFSLKLKNGTYHYTVSYIGYETATGTLKVSGKDISDFNIRLQATSLGLSEVVVTAKEQAMGSSSVIDQTALQHLQPKSVEDMLQLVPGGITQNTSMNNVGQASIREIGGDRNNSIGAAILLDGAPISNDATMMSFNTSKNGINDISGQSSTGMGVDLRTISPDNIESVEVIRGIPSVEYGNLTSGAVIIKTKQGSTPLEFKGKTDPNSKMASFGKGFTLSTGTTLNLSSDYTSSYSDIRFKAKGYERITGSVGVSQNFFGERPLELTAKISYFQNLNTVRTDPQESGREKSKSLNQGVRINLAGDWNVKGNIFSNLSYNLSVNTSHQRDEKTTFMNLRTGVQPIGSSLVEGEHQAPYLTGNYYSDYYVDGKPFSIYMLLKGTKTLIVNENFTTQIKSGLEWTFDKNNGEGLVFDVNQPPVINDVQTVRPRAYTDIPAMNVASAFLEAKTIMPIGPTSLELQAGLRAGRLFIDRSYLNAEDMVSIDPRINAEWTLVNKHDGFLVDRIAANGGWGITTKNPSLTYLYPDKAYFDRICYNSANPFFAIIDTRIVENTSNPNIKQSKGRKVEFGFTVERKKFNGSITFFHERYSNEFSFSAEPYIHTYNKYSHNLPSNAENITFNNGVFNYVQNGTNVTSASVPKPDTIFFSYQVPGNNYSTRKSGMEYSLNFGQIQALRTSLSIDGAWLWIKSRNASESWTIHDQVNGKHYPYMILMPSGYDGSITQRSNTNIRFITHIPEVKMVFSTTAQIIWMEKQQRTYTDENGNDLWYVSETIDGKPCLAVDPVKYMDRQGNIYDWDVRFRDKKYQNAEYEMIKRYVVMEYFDETKYPGHLIFNFRLTKEFGKNMELSFMANNMFNKRKIYRNPQTGSRSNLTINQYFGAELKIKI